MVGQKLEAIGPVIGQIGPVVGQIGMFRISLCSMMFSLHNTLYFFKACCIVKDFKEDVLWGNEFEVASYETKFIIIFKIIININKTGPAIGQIGPVVGQLTQTVGGVVTSVTR